MKIYSCPKEVPAPQPDYAKYDHVKEDAAEKDHMKRLAEWLRSKGFTGKYTGEVYSTGVADGSANYMMADSPKSFLIHLPYGDGYHARDIQFVPKKEIIKRIEDRKRFRELFRKKPLDNSTKSATVDA